MGVKLGATLNVRAADGDSIVLYVPKPDTDEPDMDVGEFYLTWQEQVKLCSFLMDGNCPVCWEPINLGEVICEDCFKSARRYREDHDFY